MQNSLGTWQRWQDSVGYGTLKTKYTHIEYQFKLSIQILFSSILVVNFSFPFDITIPYACVLVSIFCVLCSWWSASSCKARFNRARWASPIAINIMSVISLLCPKPMSISSNRWAYIVTFSLPCSTVFVLIAMFSVVVFE